MGKIWVEICLISARGVHASLSLWKRQWYAVGWVDPNNKYCTKVDASGNANPFWRTKFAIQVDDSDPNFQDLALNLEVYSRDPFFFTEKLHGSATVVLKEFLVKSSSEVSKAGDEEVGSYQLRGKKSNKPRGFIDVSIRVSEDKEEIDSHPGDGGGIELIDRGNNTHLTPEGGFGQANMHQMPQVSFQRPQKQPQTNVPYSHHPMPYPTNYSNYPFVGGPSYYQPPRPPPPPPPSNAGYVPTNFFPGDYGMAPSYINMPSTSSTGAGAPPRQRGPPPGFVVGAGAGALAAGAVMFGNDFMPRFDVPSGLGNPSLTIATDPLF
ncbi:hypothetical protein RIF29_17037 [Crotalaria pallida]|uniref:C2 domain-containing protein n=1 Tax=Crotalaria pallida TaxID=3830 RepID=A0AAN9FJV0_CROPI